MPILVSSLIIMLFSFLLLFLGLVLGTKASLLREKSSPFECGFTPKTSARLPFSIRFFMLSIIFLIFDVELILIFPVLPALSFFPSLVSFWVIFLVVLILVLGLFHEISQGSLTWAE